ncbi:unnamed protein product [Porites lobata]|uniref:Sushi domain-containing protein n=1 Tax=Porites lobata TaxID=104759 RepID=A0ABN8N9H5_9CNID|nr:unnamed protein product [Porites lobata]
MALMAELYKTAISLTYEEQRFDERRTNLNLCLKYWPDGLYGLPMAASGCPNDPSVNWRLGTLYQDCEDTDPETHHSFSFNLQASIIQGDVERSFCMKTTTFFDSRRKAWPPGKYCIYLSGRSCPLGMTVGWIVWDDENASIPGTSNRNHHNGTLPAGKYDSNTLIYYCCSTSGSAQYPISLPLESPFYLIAYGTRTCQAVRGAKSTLEYIYYETEIFTLMSMDDYGGAHPYGVAKGGKGHVIFYCYYTPIYCPPLKRPDNGKLKPFRCGERNNNKFNDTCSLSCNPGYIPENPAGQVTTCLENGTWSNPYLTGCKRKIVAEVILLHCDDNDDDDDDDEDDDDQGSFQNITASPVTKYLTTSSTPVLSWTQSRLQQTTASTPLNLSTTSCFVSPPSITVSSSVIQVSRASSLWSSTTPSPTLPSVGSSIPPVEEEVGSSYNTLQDTNFLIGAIAGGALLLVIIILSLVIRRRR